MRIKKWMASVLLVLASVLGAVNVSKAVSLNPEGLGQVLIYPYYTTRGGNDTFISVLNTTDKAKSVRVRFLEGVNSREVLSFNLYLAAFDVWVAALTTTANGDGVDLMVPDSSCTVPYFFGDAVIDSGEMELFRLGRVEFSDAFFTGQFDDPGPDALERVQSGYIEIIEMGTLVDDTEGSATAATHVFTSFDNMPNDLIRPANCVQLVDAWNDGYWSNDAIVDHEPPSGGLRGGATIIDVLSGIMFTYRAEAIDGFSTEIIHSGPTEAHPDLSSGNVTTSHVYSNGAIDTQTWQTSVEAVSAAIMHDSLINEYIVDPNVAAASEWVVTFPTKRFYTDPLAAIDEVPVAPFSAAFDGITDCEPFEFQLRDRETALEFSIDPPSTGLPVPRPDRTFRLCNGANIVRFTQDRLSAPPPSATEIMGESRFSTISVDVAVDVANSMGSTDIYGGWLQLDLSTLGDTHRQTRSIVDASGTDTGFAYIGLPAIGFWVNTFTNGTLAGGTVLSNYGGIIRHTGSGAVKVVQPETP